MTDPERMAALAETLKRISDELHAVAGEYSALGIESHASETRCAAGLLSIYSHQLTARIQRGML